MITPETTPVARWFEPLTGDNDAALRLFLLPYAGGGTWIYHEWPALLPTDIAVTAIALPAREQRRAEPPFTQPEPLVDALCEALTAELDGRPYALFGHSMGALLAYRTGITLERAGEQRPALVAASGWAPEGFRMPEQDQTELSDAALLERIRAIGALPIEAIDDPELLAMIIPVLRADLAVCAGYRDDQARLLAPLVGYCGAADPLMSPAAMCSWANRTEQYLGHRIFPGGHFFVHDQATVITAELATLLRCHARP